MGPSRSARSRLTAATADARTLRGPSRLTAATADARSLPALVVLVALIASGPMASVALARSQPAAVIASTGRHATPTLSLGSRGPAVRALQSALARLTYLPPGAIDGTFGMQTWHAVVAFQGWSGLERDGVAGSLMRRALARARRPVPWSTAAGFEIHIAQQVLLLIRGGRVRRAIHVSTGRPGWPTPVGRFTILERDLMSWSAPFQVWMPLAQYFDDGYALHEFAEVPAYPASHGCIRVPSEEAQAVWRFGRVGMRLWTSP